MNTENKWPPNSLFSYERDGSCGINAGCESEGCRCDLDSMKEAYNLDEPDFQGVHFKCNNETMGVIIGNF